MRRRLVSTPSPELRRKSMLLVSCRSCRSLHEQRDATASSSVCPACAKPEEPAATRTTLSSPTSDS